MRRIQIKAIYLYLLSLFWVVFLGVLLRLTDFKATGLGMTLAVLTLIFLPGVFLWRLIKMTQENLAIRLLYIIGLGWVFYLLLNFLALIFKMSLGQLSFAIGFFALILYGLSFWEDRQSVVSFNLEWFKKQTAGDWLLFILMFLGSLAAFWGVSGQADKFIGDGAFHLAILEKVVSTNNLDPYHLWITKTDSLNLVYSFPIWHLFLGFLAQILNLNIFTTYYLVLLPLVVLTILVVGGLASALFKNRYLATIVFLTFLAWSLSAGIFYNLVPLRSPDSLVRLLLLPLVLGLTAHYLFSENSEKLPNILLITLLVIFMGLIHFTQLIEYVLILGLLFIVLVIGDRQKEKWSKTGWLLLAIVGILAFYLGIFHFEAIRQFFLGNLANFSGDNFANRSYRDTGNIYLYIVFSLPILAIFARERRFLFLLVIALTCLAISWQFFHLRIFFLKYFGEIFTIRAINDIPGFVYLGLLLFFLMAGLNRLLARQKVILYSSSLILIVFFLAMFLIEPLKLPIAVFIDQAFFTPKNSFFYTYFLPILILLATVSLVIYIYQHFIQKKELSIPDLQAKLNFAIIALVIFAIFSLPYAANFWALAKNPKTSILRPRQIANLGDLDRLGGQKTLDFLNTLPASSVLVISDVTTAQILAPYLKQYLAEYPFAIQKFTFSQKIYDPNISLDERLQILQNHSIDYIICLRSYETEIFAADPQFFSQIFATNFSYRLEGPQGPYEKSRDFVVFQYLR